MQSTETIYVSAITGMRLINVDPVFDANASYIVYVCFMQHADSRSLDRFAIAVDNEHGTKCGCVEEMRCCGFTEKIVEQAVPVRSAGILQGLAVYLGHEGRIRHLGDGEYGIICDAPYERLERGFIQEKLIELSVSPFV